MLSLWRGLVLAAVLGLLAGCSATTTPGPNGSPPLSPVETGPTETSAGTPEGTETASHGPSGILFVRRPQSGGNASLLLVRPDGSGLQKLTDGKTDDVAPAWSADGTSIAFARAGSEVAAHDIWVMASDGSGASDLTGDPSNDDTWPSWSADSAYIAFSQGPAGGGDHSIAIMASDGSQLTPLTSGPGDDTSPIWSPDGGSIAFLRSTAGAGNPTDIYVMDADGSNLKRLTKLNDVRSLSWSPDGTKIAFGVATCCVDSTSWIDVMNADGSGIKKLTTGKSPALDPAWSPDGTEIAFAGAGGISVMHADGTHVVTLTKATATVDDSPDWY